MAIKTGQQGITLIEMIVVVAIFSVVAAVLFFKFSDFNNGISIRNLSQEVALSVRKAQTYATSVRSLDGVTTTSETYPAYGISFSPNVPTDPYAPSNRQFVIFADAVDGGGLIDRYYDDGNVCGNPQAGSECVESFSISSADRIVRLCTDYPTADSCITTGIVNVVFRRPAPDAEICVVSNGQCPNTLASYLKVVIQSPKGTERTVTIWNTGQISGQ